MSVAMKAGDRPARAHDGFTLIEVMITVAVVAILSIVLWYAYGKRDFMNSAEEATHLTKSADKLLEE